MAAILVALDSFSCTVDGNRYDVSKGATVREGHPVIAGRESLFGPLVPHYEHVAPKAAPAKAAPPATAAVTLKVGGADK